MGKVKGLDHFFLCKKKRMVLESGEFIGLWVRSQVSSCLQVVFSIQSGSQETVEKKIDRKTQDVLSELRVLLKFNTIIEWYQSACFGVGTERDLSISEVPLSPGECDKPQKGK